MNILEYIPSESPITVHQALYSIAGIIAVWYSIKSARFLYRVPETPKFDTFKWWGIGSQPKEENRSIKPFNVDFKDEMVKDLKRRIRNRRRLTKPLDGKKSEYGMNTNYLENLVNYWLERYDFQRRANSFNKFPHFKTRVQGIDIHYVRVASRAPRHMDVIPLLMLHGWPSSSKEFYKVIPQLTSPHRSYKFVFEVVAADLPGCGFSEATSKPGMTPVQMAIIMRNLMMRLGFHRFYIHAGDWGSQCATHMAVLFPDQVLGLHTNMAVSTRPISYFKMLLGSLCPRLAVNSQCRSRIYPLKKLFTFFINQCAYFHFQATKPDTIGVALSDTPIGLAAYIMQIMAINSNRDKLNTAHGGLECLQIDDVLDTITVAWVNNCMTTSMRIFAEAMSNEWPEVSIIQRIPTDVPTAVLQLKHELLYQPYWILKDKFRKLVRISVHDVGGHYAALQCPQIFTEDLFASVETFIDIHREHEVSLRDLEESYGTPL